MIGRTIIFGSLITLVLLLAVVWAAAALWLDGPAVDWQASALAVGFAAGCLGLLLWMRPYYRALLVVLVALGVVIAWWMTIPPRNDRDWLPDVARLATATVAGNRLTVDNVRNFDYRGEADYTEHWETRTYNLDQLQGMDLFISFWGPQAIAHTIASWEFAGGPPLAISIETRKEQGEAYSALRGFFRQFEVYYVVADERDVVRLRTNYRGERLFLYRITMTPAAARDLLLDYLAEVNRLARHPRWYNALIHNCTTAIRYHLKNLGLAQKLDWRILANGYLDELLYERGRIDTDLPFAELRSRSDITERAKAADKDPLFSARIREGLPASRLSSKSE